MTMFIEKRLRIFYRIFFNNYRINITGHQLLNVSVIARSSVYFNYT